MNREKDKDEESEEDAWFESIKEQQAEMLLKQTQRQQDSEASESEDDLGDESQGGINSDENESKVDKFEAHREIIALKRDLVMLLNSSTNETANMAL